MTADTLRSAADTFAAALEAARILCACNPYYAEDRASYRAAKARLEAMLPEGESASDHILRAVRWDAVNSLAAICAGVPTAKRAANIRRMG